MGLPAAIPAVLLVGGAGSRLRSVSGDLPKPMVPIAGRPFVEHLLQFLRRCGVRRVVLSAGYGAGVLREHFGDGSKLGLDIAYSVEEELQGTGGAIRLGAERAAGDRILVLNGDSFAELDLGAMHAFHLARPARITVGLVEVPDAGRFGTVELDPETRALTGFREKSGTGAGMINAGVYLIERAVIGDFPPGKLSFERDVLPGLLGHGAYGFVTRGLFVDIGVPEDYRRLAAEPSRFLAAVA